MKDIEAVIKWYGKNRPLYESLARKAEEIIKENLEQRGIQYHSVTSRGKELESFTKKAKSEKYSDPVHEIKDMAGIRVITYLESDVSKVANIIESLFDIDKGNSLDQSQLLGSDKLGYRSVHYIAKFNKKRCKLPEYKPYENLPFEIQIRSILQHAWAEIEHDRNYKFTGKLPTQLERRFYLISGMLECADREFVAIAKEIDEYKNTVVEELDKGELDIEINTASLTEYLSKRFKNLVKEDLLVNNFEEGEIATTIVKELNLFGISKLYQLDKIIPVDFHDKVLSLHYWNTYAGCIRDILITNDAKKYFGLSWHKEWTSTDLETLHLWESYSLNIPHFRDYLEENGIQIEPFPEQRTLKSQ